MAVIERGSLFETRCTMLALHDATDSIPVTTGTNCVAFLVCIVSSQSTCILAVSLYDEKPLFCMDQHF